MIDVVTLGETMIVMNPEETGKLKYVYDYKKQLGGAESNFAIGLSRLGHKVGWIGKLGADPHGKYIHSFIRGEGVDTSQVKYTEDFPTGLLFKERREVGESSIYYYRKNSAASKLKPDELSEEYITQADYLHLTGITPALSKSCYQTVLKAIKIARKNDLQISFDPNIRLKLWAEEEMKEILNDLLEKVDIVFPGKREGEILLGTSEEKEIAEEILAKGAKTVAVKLGSQGALVANKNKMKKVTGYQVEREVDPVGAGDAFAAGFIAGQLRDYNLTETARLANAVGAFAVTVRGDVEGLPTEEEVKMIMGKKEKVYR